MLKYEYVVVFGCYVWLSWWLVCYTWMLKD